MYRRRSLVAGFLPLALTACCASAAARSGGAVDVTWRSGTFQQHQALASSCGLSDPQLVGGPAFSYTRYALRPSRDVAAEQATVRACLSASDLVASATFPG